MDDLAACLRRWRDRTDPAELGLPGGSARRAPGLRREEVATLAGLSVDYLSRLEQGRAKHPSVSVLEPLARTLRLTDEERAHLFRLAGHGGPMAGHIRRHITPAVRMRDRLGPDVPILALDLAWYMLDANPLAEALLGPMDGDGPHARNHLWRTFTDAPTRVRHEPDEAAAFRVAAVADLHRTLGNHPGDPTVTRLVADLREASSDFDELWEQRPVAPIASSRKAVEHPEVGDVWVDCDVLMVAGSDVRLVVYTAAPGTEAASKLALLGAIGQQTF